MRNGTGGRVSQRLQDTLLRYGQVGLVVHFCLSGISIFSCYLAVRHQLPMDRLLELVGKTQETSDSSSDALSAGSSLFMAFVIHKAIMPLRVPVTVAVTPLAARVWWHFSKR
ncbi:FAM210B [Symbiodinium natans]|uniref:FAM210B protein n=1 Tax=Symbiodinium natans TaxID=878477 RepID=A0A812P3U7_9DINO|nr:FAM210B [Symbiodinium natans]